ncbi:MAG: autoinducer binding domain-containing protein [Pseudomonadales bacterium]|nr:autoinducer binding domain-containing protein [Pseudomonadales bacterium]
MATAAIDKLKAFLEVEGVALIKIKISESGKRTISHIITSDFDGTGSKKEWESVYLQESLQNVDPIVAASIVTPHPFNWSSITSIIDISPEQSLFLAKAQEAGLINGASASSVTCKKLYHELNILSVSGRNLTEGQLEVLRLLQSCTCSLLEKSVDGAQQLTPREHEVLAWLAEGKSYWDISTICNISERTVKFHIQNIYQKLNAQNRSQAIVVAMKRGMI